MADLPHTCITSIKYNMLQYTWIINNYSEHHKNWGTLQSCVFSDEKSNTEWSFKLHPDNGDAESTIELFLCPGVPLSWGSKIQFSLGEELIKKIYPFKDEYKLRLTEEGSLIRKFVNYGLLGKESGVTKKSLEKDGILKNDRLTITCDIAICNKVDELSEKKPSLIEKIPPCVLRDDFLNLLEGGKFSDVTLCANGQEFKVHKSILCTRSPIFGAMFNHDMKETQNNRVDLVDIEPNVLKELLMFIYGGVTSLEKVGDAEDVVNKQNLATELLKASDRYQLVRLKVICETTLTEMLTVDSVAEMLELSDLYSLTLLKDRALEILYSNADVTKTEGWKRVAKENPSSLLTVLEGQIKDTLKLI